MSDRPPIESAVTPLISMLNIGGQIFCRALTRVTVSGAIDEIPRKGPLIIAANHASNLDAVVLGSWIVPKLGRRINWLGKKELFEWPILGYLAAHGGVHPVDRGAADVEAFRLARRILDEWNDLLIHRAPAFHWPETGTPIQWEQGQGVVMGWEADGRLKVTTATGIERLSAAEISGMGPR